MEQIEKKQIEYLKKRKEALISGFIVACEEINDQIKDVKSGKWLEEMTATRTYDIPFALERVKPIIEADKGE